VNFPFGCTQIIFVIERLVSYGQATIFPTLVNIDAEDEIINPKIHTNSSNNIASAKII